MNGFLVFVGMVIRNEILHTGKYSCRRVNSLSQLTSIVAVLKLQYSVLGFDVVL